MRLQQAKNAKMAQKTTKDNKKERKMDATRNARRMRMTHSSVTDGRTYRSTTQSTGQKSSVCVAGHGAREKGREFIVLHTNPPWKCRMACRHDGIWPRPTSPDKSEITVLLLSFTRYRLVLNLGGTGLLSLWWS